MEWLVAFKDFGFPAVMAIALLVVLTRNIQKIDNDLRDICDKITKLDTKFDMQSMYRDRERDNKK